MLASHYKNTVERVKDTDAKYILAIQDGMRLNFTKHAAKTEMGLISKSGYRGKTPQYGLIQHSTLCVTDKNEPLGLLDIQHFHYDEIDTSVHHHHRFLEEKATRYWVNALNNMRKRLKGVDKKIITVADREGDFFEFLHALTVNNEDFVIRALHDRHTGEKHRDRGEKISDLLEQCEINGITEVVIQDVNTREMTTIELQLKAMEITLPPPNKSKEEQIGKEDFKPIKVNIVKAYNDEHEWTILTTLSIDTLENIIEIIDIYRSRWHIEDYHKVLKTGYQVDEIYLHSSRQTIENLLAISSISACRLYWLIYIGRSELNVQADRLFEEFEWKAMYVFFKEKIPEQCPPISEVILRIARLGGYKPIKKGQPPGIKTIWIGYQQFTIAAQMYRNMSNKT